MGRLLLVWRLACGDIKRRRTQSVLLVVMIAATTATLALALALRDVNDRPFARTRTATKGPDVVAMYGVWGFSRPPAASSRSLAQFQALAHAPGVVASSGPYPLVFPTLSARGRSVQAFVVGRAAAPATVDQPLVTSGRWVRAGGAVLERAFADALGVRVGGAIRLDGRSFRVVGIALATSQAFYPEGYGVVWLARADAEHLSPTARPAGYVLNLKLAHPSAAGAFAAAHAAPATSPAALQPWSLEPWQQIRSGDLKVIAVEQQVLLIASSLLSIFAVASIVVLVGARMAEQTRRVGLLKAVGGTPTLIAVILLVENLVLALIAAGIGLGVGRLLAPALTDAGNGLLGSPSSSPTTLGSAALVVLVGVGVTVLATLAPAIRGARTSTLSALNDTGRAPGRRPLLIAFSARLPVPLLLGLRLLARRTRRAVLTTISLTIASAMIVAALTVRHQMGLDQPSAQHHPGMLPGTFLVDRVSHLVFLVTAILIVLAAISAIITTWVTVLDSQRSTALARALGATPGQIGVGLAAAQLLPALVAACLGVPLGLGLYVLANHNGNVNPPVPALLAMIPGTLAVVASLTVIPARLGARRPVAQTLGSE